MKVILIIKITNPQGQPIYSDASHNTALRDLWWEYNQLTELDISNNTTLEEFDAINNSLTKIWIWMAFFDTAHDNFALNRR